MTEKSDFKKKIAATRKKLDLVSPSLCLAKWLQSSIYLQTGLTHSCHHPATHKVPLPEIQRSPSALHNTCHKKNSRKQMLEGKRPDECDYCWRVEDLSSEQISDRLIKSSDDWATDSFETVKSNPWDANVNPTYVEVSFSNVCNFKCAYCQPSVSSKWFSEISEIGPYPTQDRYNALDTLNALPIESEEDNPYVKAFWDWWPSLINDLRVLRITGGEPLLAKGTFRIFDELERSPRPALELALNTNLGVSRTIVEILLERVIRLRSKNAIKSFSLYTSIDTWGADAEYLRDGLDLVRFEENVKLALKALPQSRLTFTCTFNLLSIPRFHELIGKVSEWKSFASDPGLVTLDIPYLRYPQFLSVRLSGPEQIEKLEADLKRIREHGHFREEEIAKFTRVLEHARRQPFLNVERTRLLYDFSSFITEYDRRRGLNARSVFPSLKALFDEAEKAAFSCKVLDILSLQKS